MKTLLKRKELIERRLSHLPNDSPERETLEQLLENIEHEIASHPERPQQEIIEEVEDEDS